MNANLIIYFIVAALVFIALTIYARISSSGNDGHDLFLAVMASLFWGVAVPVAVIAFSIRLMTDCWVRWVNK